MPNNCQSASLAEAKAVIEHYLPDLTSNKDRVRKDALARICDLVELTHALERRGAPLPSNAKGTCEACDYWERERDHKGRPMSDGICHRAAPAAGEQPWPITSMIDWCGEFRPRTGWATPRWTEIYDPRTGSLR